MSDVNAQIAPFYWVDGDNSSSVCMTDICDYQQFIFDSRRNDGFRGDGYDWQSLADIFIKEHLPQLSDDIHFDSESDMFCVYSTNKDALKQFALEFKKACENKELILDLFSRAELD